MFGCRGVLGCPIPEDLPERLIREEVCEIVGFEGKGNIWRACGQMDGGNRIEASTLTRRSLPSNGMAQVGIARKKREVGPQNSVRAEEAGLVSSRKGLNRPDTVIAT